MNGALKSLSEVLCLGPGIAKKALERPQRDFSEGIFIGEMHHWTFGDESNPVPTGDFWSPLLPNEEPNRDGPKWASAGPKGPAKGPGTLFVFFHHFGSTRLELISRDNGAPMRR